MAAVAIVLFLLAAAKVTRADDRRKQPHIVFILADDLGWNDVSYHGSPQILTPNIDALAWNGIRLNRYYTQPLCTPSRSAFLTGCYPMNTGMQHSVILTTEPRGLPLHYKLLPQWLGDFGYVSRMLGKWHLGYYKEEYTPTMRGFQSHVGSWEGFSDYYSHIMDFSWQTWSISGHDFRRDMQKSKEDDGRYYTHVMTEEALKIIKDHPNEKPLFLYIAHLAVHSGNQPEPLKAPTKYTDPYMDIGHPSRTLYAGMLSVLDESVGAVFEALGRRGILNETIVVLTTDNGAGITTQFSSFGSGWPFRGQKGTAWEGGVRVPAVVWSPLFSEHRGAVVESLFHVSDWLPTFYELAGGDPSNLGEIDGISQLDTLRHREKLPRTEIVLNIDPIENVSAIIVYPFKLMQGDDQGGHYDDWYPFMGNVTRTQKDAREGCEASVVYRVMKHSGFVVTCGQDPVTYATSVKCGEKDPTKACKPIVKPCLFDLSKDPCEYNDIAAENIEVFELLKAKLRKYTASSTPPANVPADPRGDPALHNNDFVPWGDAEGND
ncbi:arylsulfatase B-like [Ixodes scapularis]|uniref:arylsulfatase B-like n=1 Tax=Ixodes scapularis TaxID=6945 RepID=UPI001A9CC2F8|nr:arylsulfatase B-like [Ixodes scapularis]